MAEVSNTQGKTPDSKEGFWHKEVRLFKAEMAGWSLPRAAKKELKKQNRESQKAPQIKEVQISKEKKAENTVKPTSKEWSKPKKVTFYTLTGTALTLSFVAITFCASAFAYKQCFEQKAYYGTKILGQEVGGMNLLQVRDLISAKTGTVSLNFLVEGENVQIKPVDAGVNFNPDSTAIQALRKGKFGNWYDPYLYSASSLFYKISPALSEKIQPKMKESLALDYTIDEQKLATLTQNLSQSFNVQSKNAGLVMRGTDVQVIPAVYGKQIITDSVKLQIAEAVRSAQTANIEIQVEKVNPSIVEADTQKSIESAKTILNLPVSFHYQGKTYTPDKATVGGWIIFNTVKVNGKDQLVPAVDAKLVYPYVYSVSSKINIPAVNKKVTITNGSSQKVDQEGKDGLAVNVDSASLTTAKSLTSGKSVSLELPTYTVKAKTTVNDLTVADWSKYIDINISKQRMCAYLSGGNQQACWSITSAATGKGYHTPIGTFLIQRKVYVTSMPNPPSPYPLNNIHYVSYFTSAGHAIHEAWWRSSFGGDPTWNGSHGCVNASLSAAQWIYNWAPIGTPVIIHY